MVLLVACTPELEPWPEPVLAPWCDPVGEPALEIGPGHEEFRVFDAEDELPQVLGHQGSYHLDLSLRPSGLDITDPMPADIVVTVADQVVAEAHPRVVFFCSDALIIEPDHHHLFLDEPLAHGTLARVEAAVTDPWGEVATVSIYLPVSPP
jgi:hypothetical protein